MRNDDAAAWRKMKQIYEPLILFWCRRYGGLSAHDAADVVQEAFTSVYQALARFQYDGPRRSFRGWLRTIVVNKIRDVFRLRKRTLGLPGRHDLLAELANSPNSDPVDFGQSNTETNIVLIRTLDVLRTQFNDSHWKAFWSTTIENRSAADVAAELGLTVGAVYTAKSRVLHEIRMLLKGLDENDLALD